MTTTPLKLASVGRTFAALPSLGTAPVDAVRRVAALPAVAELPEDQPVVVLLDAALAANAAAVSALGDRAAFLGVGAAGAVEPGPALPADVLCGFIAEDAAPANRELKKLS